MELTLSKPGDNVLGWMAACLVTGLVLLVHRLTSRSPIEKFPLLGKQYGNARKRTQAFLERPLELYYEGYQSFRDQIYRLTMPDGDHLIMPRKYLDELRKRPDDEIDLLKSFNAAFANEYIGMFPPKERNDVANSVVKGELTKSLARLNPRLSNEVDRTIREEMPPCKDWTPVDIFPMLLKLVAIISGNVLVGPDLCRHEVYLAAAINYTVDVTDAGKALKRWPKYLRRLVVLLNLEPAVSTTQEHRKRVRACLGPLIEERRRLLREGRPVPEDLLQWMIEKANEHNILDIAHITDMMLILIVASIHQTSMSTCGMLYDLCTSPEVIPDLRKEIASVLEETDGVMTSKALFNMKLLDSFMRESQRLHPTFTDSFRRYVEKTMKLQDGTVIPAGTFIECHNIPVLHDPAFYKDPDVFDPYRFYNLRTNAAYPDPNNFRSREQYQFVSVTKENVSFGFGRHACPGRFFAANEIKLLMARFLLEYDVRFPPGVKERYPDWTLGSLMGPNTAGIVEFKRGQR